MKQQNIDIKKKHITFNNETGVWRIIGVFEVETPNGSGYTKEYKVKIVMDSIGKAAWNAKNQISSTKWYLGNAAYSSDSSKDYRS